MRIVFLTRKFYRVHGYGGMEKYVWALARHLALQGDEVHIVTLPPKVGVNGEQKVIDGVRMHYIHLPAENIWHSGIQYFLYAHQAAKLIHQIQPDIVQSFGIGALFYLQKPIDRRSPVVIQAFGNEWFFLGGLRGLIRSPLKMALRSCMHRCEAIAAETEGQIAEITSLFDVPTERVFILPDGVEYSAFTVIGDNPAKSRGSDKTVNVLNVNRLAPNKGVADFVTALADLRDRNIQFHAIIIGTGPEETKIIQLISDLHLEDYVTHLRDVSEEELVHQYNQADIFVCPTLQEGLPLVLLEALSAGLLIVATRAAQNETVIDHNKNGILVPPRNPKAIAEGILRLINTSLDERKRMSENAQQTAAAYDWRLIASRAHRHYQGLIEAYKRS